MCRDGWAQRFKIYSLKSHMSPLIWVSTPSISILVGFVAHVAATPQVSSSLCSVVLRLRHDDSSWVGRLPFGALALDYRPERALCEMCEGKIVVIGVGGVPYGVIVPKVLRTRTLHKRYQVLADARLPKVFVEFIGKRGS